ncbi:MAG TPA: class I SAM-dependent methyltransferase [Stenotrophomonas sp.]|jgi:16S rRNA (guanine1207-N2)-methyltransferase
MPAPADAPLQTLFLPFSQGLLRWPSGPVLFLRAREGWALREHADPGTLVCTQSFRPFADELTRAGWSVQDEETAQGDATRYALVVVLPPRQREEARALMAQALGRLAPGGVLVACQSNNEGARSGEADLRQLAGPGGNLTKNHCRVFWTAPQQQAHDPVLAARWATLDAPRRVLDGRFLSRPGVFAWDRIDPASALLAEQLPADLAGRGADLGAGYGYLSTEVLARCARVTGLDLYEAEARALAMARANLAPLAGEARLDYRWQDVTAGIEAGYDFIVSNPPFHTPAREDRPDIGQRFIAVAAQALRPGGRLFIVANRHLPYERVLNEGFGEVRIAAERGGFKAIVARKAGRA